MMSAVVLSKYGKCDNWITNEYCISNETVWECIVTRNKKGNILGNHTERQNGQHTHQLVVIQDRKREMEKEVHTIKQMVNTWMRSDNRVQGDQMSRS